MTTELKFFVPGKPIPKGNHDAFPIRRGFCEDCKAKRLCRRKNCFNGVIVGTVVSDSKGEELKAWEAMVKVHAMSARNVAGARILAAPGALEVRLVFVFERPKSHFTTKGVLSSEAYARPMPTVKPDWDKVARATADALTGSLVEDDGQIVTASVDKVYGAKPGVAIATRPIVRPSDAADALLRALGIETSIAVQGALF